MEGTDVRKATEAMEQGRLCHGYKSLVYTLLRVEQFLQAILEKVNYTSQIRVYLGTTNAMILKNA